MRAGSRQTIHPTLLLGAAFALALGGCGDFKPGKAGRHTPAAVVFIPSVEMNPTAKTLGVGDVFAFAASAGTPAYVFSIRSGAGSVDPVTGTFTAPATPGTTVLRVTDSGARTAEAVITIGAALSVAPPTQELAIGNSAAFTGAGGAPPYAYSLASGGGILDPITGAYTAPGAAGAATVRVTDSLGHTSDAAITIRAALAISPSSKTLAVSNSFTFSATGGVAPLSYSVFAGDGSVVSSSGLYTAPAASGAATVRVTDALGNTSDATVTIKPALAIVPGVKTLAVGNTFTFSATGGVSPYSYSITAGGGSINSSSGLYTAPAASGSATVRVTDSLGNTSNAAVTINAALAIVPTAKTLAVGNSFTFSATGGVSAYTYAITAGGGAVNSSSGLYTAPGSTGTSTVRVTDSLGNTSNATVTIDPALTISPLNVILIGGKTASFAGAGGVPGYTYSVSAGGGSVGAGTGVFTAPPASGNSTIRVVDSIGNTASAAAKTYVWTTVDSFQLAAASNASCTALHITPAGALYAVGNAADSNLSHWIVRKSTDTGTSWAVADTYQYQAGRSSFALQAGSDSTGNLYVVGYGNTTSADRWLVRKSTNAATSWTLADNFQYTAGRRARAQAFGTDSSGNLYVAGFGNSIAGDRWVVRQSVNSGSTWSTIDDYQLSSGRAARAFAFTADSGDVYAGGYATNASNVRQWMVRKSINSGSTWIAVDTFSYSASGAAQVNALGFDSSGDLYAAGQGADNGGKNHWLVRHSADSGATWNTLDDFQYVSGQNSQATAFATDAAGTLYVSGYAAAADASLHWLVRMSTDSGATWVLIEDYQLTASQDSRALGFGVHPSGTLFTVGSGSDGASTFWQTRKY